MEHAASVIDVSGRRVRRSKHDHLAAYKARVLDQATAVLRVHAVDLPVDDVCLSAAGDGEKALGKRCSNAPPLVPVEGAFLPGWKRSF